MKEKATILDYIQAVADMFPAPVYWEDLDNVILGVNNVVVELTGAKSREFLIGKTVYDLYPREMAEKIIEHNNYVMRTGEISSQEEVIVDISSGEKKYFKAFKAPLRNDKGEIIGVFGTSVDITSEKRAQDLKLKLEKSEENLNEKNLFQKAVEQIAHDIRSPLATLLMVVKGCENLSEWERIALREVATRIGDVTSQLLSRYKEGEKEAVIEDEKQEFLLVSSALLQLLAEKKYEYEGKKDKDGNHISVRVEDDFAPEGHFAFIHVGQSGFKRMLSNLINNAYDAFAGAKVESPKITVGLAADAEYVTISVRDNGKGMPESIMQKIKEGVAVTSGKESGHGIGLTQVREALQRAGATFDLQSIVDMGTKITLTFPRVAAPAWIGNKITLHHDDTVVILDDDPSIHIAWNGRFDPLLLENPHLKVEHFQEGDKALAFFSNLTEEQKGHVFFLSDYELLKQKRNGLEIIEASGLKRFLLVTSRYADADVRAEAERINCRILPKRLAPEVPIVFAAVTEDTAIENNESVDVVIVDDDPFFPRSVEVVLRHQTVRTYPNPTVFLSDLDKYKKDTVILLDNHFSPSHMTGITLAEILNEKGYTQLYLISGTHFAPGELPEYLQVIPKMNVDKICQVIEGLFPKA